MSAPTDQLSLAAAFPPASRAQWRSLCDAVLRGARFEDRLISHSADGLAIEPLYPRATDAAPVTGRTPGARWQVAARIDHPDPSACNAEALHELDNGANALTLIPAGAIGARGYGLPSSPDAIAATLAGVHLDAGIAITLEYSPHAPHLHAAIADLVQRQGTAAADVDIRFGLDPLGAFARYGRGHAPWSTASTELAAAARDLAQRGFRKPFAVADGRVIHDAGGTEAQELAYVLGVAVAYLRALEGGGIRVDDARRMIAFRLTATADQYLTTAKFRALRRLWQRIEESCGVVPAPAIVEGETAWRTMTRDDCHVNILRSSIAVFSAGIGGANAIAVLGFTAPRGLPDRFARRVARNTQLVLLEEAGIAQVADPTAGTGWSEQLTDQLARAAWALFQEIETAGGSAAALERGAIQAQVAAARAAREQALTDKTDALIGATDYPMVVDAAVLDVPCVALAELPVVVACQPLIPTRLAAPYESVSS